MPPLVGPLLLPGKSSHGGPSPTQDLGVVVGRRAIPPPSTPSARPPSKDEGSTRQAVRDESDDGREEEKREEGEVTTTDGADNLAGLLLGKAIGDMPVQKAQPTPYKEVKRTAPEKKKKKDGESKVVGFASQGFHVPTNDDDLIAGNAVLTPGGSYNNGNMLGGPLKSQVKGWLVPPETGEYVFWIHSNNKGEFWLSTDSHAANKVLLSCKQKSIETRYWTMCTGPLISLVAGHKYYYEVRKLVIFTMF